MKDENQEAQVDSTDIPPKRKRGRPPKSHLLYSGEKAHVPHRLDGKKKPRCKKIDSSMRSFTLNNFVGQSVHGVLDGSFDAGYLVRVKVGDTDTVLRGVVFHPGLSVPISKENDIAPNVSMTRIDESILVPPELPPSIQSAMAIPSTSPLLPTTVPVVNSQGTTSVPIPDQTAPPVQAGSNQTRVVSGQPNGSSPKLAPDHSSQINKEPAPQPGESFSYFQQPIPIPTEPVSHPQQSISILTGPARCLQQPISSPIEPVSYTQQQIPNLTEPVSHTKQPIPTPPKRKRGRPHKSCPPLYPGEKAHVPQQLDGKKKPRCKKIDSSMSSFPENTFVGQSVHGVVFDPGFSVPISKANDIAPNVNMTRIDENILLPPEIPPSIQSTMQPIPTPAETAFHPQQSIPTPAEPVSHPQKQNCPHTKPVSHPQ